MTGSLIVRSESPADAPSVHAVNAAAFGRDDEAHLADNLRAHGKVVYSAVAEENERIVGHILFSPVRIDGSSSTIRAVGLAPMAVLPELQRQGIGAQLIAHSLDRLREGLTDLVVVLGHPNYYPRFGFVRASTFGLRCEFEAPDEAFMAVALHPVETRGTRGTVCYASEFREL